MHTSSFRRAVRLLIVPLVVAITLIVAGNLVLEGQLPSAHAQDPAFGVTINQGEGQDDPTASSPIVFFVSFDAQVGGFTAEDIELTGTAGATNAAIFTSTESTPASTKYFVSVSGMTSSGTVIASIPAGVVTGATGGTNSASTSTDNVVTYNSAAIANPDQYTLDEDTSLNVAAPGVLDNDTDAIAGDGLTAVLVSGPSHAASFALNADGSFSYTPVANYNGPDSFSYVANDGIVDSNIAAVSLTINSVYDPPTKEQCKNHGWKTLTRADGSPFKNQGDCIQYALTGK